MIKCELHLSEWFPGVAKAFTTFECKNFTELKDKIEEKLITIQLLEPQMHDELSLDVDLVHDSVRLDSKDFKDFLEFICSHSSPVLRINLKHCAIELVHQIDEAYWSAVKKWHIMQMQANPTQKIIQEKFHALPPVILESVFQGSYDEINSAGVALKSLAQRTAGDRVIHLTKLKAIRNLKSYLEDPFLTGYHEIIMACCLGDNDVTLLNSIVGCIGNEGLLNILKYLSKWPRNHLKVLINAFFSVTKSAESIEQYLPLIIRPEGKELLEMVAKLPKEIVPHWLAWMELQIDGIFNPKKAIHKIYELSQLIEKYHVSIVQSYAEDEGKFFERIELLKDLLDQNHAIWKGRKQYYPIQAPYLLSLPIEVLSDFESTLNQSGCCWLRQEMFIKGSRLKKLQPNEASACDLSSFYNYASQFMQDRQESAFHDIENSIQAFMPSSAFEWQLAAWCVALPKQPAFESYQFLKDTPEADREALIDVLYHLPLDKRPSSQMLVAILSKAKGRYVCFLKAYDFLFKNDPNAKAIWALVLSSDYSDWHVQKMDECLSSIDLRNQDKIFALLLLPFAQEFLVYDECCRLFRSLSDDKKELLLQILSSYQCVDGEIILSLHDIHSVIEKSLFDDVFLERSFQTLPDARFDYFKKSLDTQQVMLSIVNLLEVVKSSFGLLLDKNAKILGTPMSAYITQPVLTELKSKVEELNDLLDFLKILDIHKPEDITRLDESLTTLSHYFQSFFEKPFNAIINDSTGFVGMALGLKNQDSMQKLFSHVYINYQNYKSFLGHYFSEEKLKVIHEIDLKKENILQKYIEYDLGLLFKKKIESYAEEQVLLGVSDRSRTIVIENLVAYISRVNLNVEGIQSFFNRCESLNKQIENAPELEHKCFDNDLDPLSIWKILTKDLQNHQNDSFWKIAEEILDGLIANKNGFDEKGAFSFYRIYELLMDCVDIFPKNLNENGDVNHPYWRLCVQELIKFISNEKILKHPMFGFLLKDSIEYVLSKGKDYDFAFNVQLYESVGKKNPDLMKTLQQLLSESTVENQTLLYGVLEKTRICMTNQKSPYYAEVVTRILGFPELATHLNDIDNMLAWLLAHDRFVWFDILAADNHWGYSELFGLYRAFNKNGVLAQAYVKKFPTESREMEKKVNEPVVMEQLQLQSMPVKEVFFEWFISKIPIKTFRDLAQAGVRAIMAPQNQLVDELNKVEEQKTLQGLWTICATYPYPSVCQMTSWLNASSIKPIYDDIQTYDIQPKTSIHYSEEDFDRWVSEVEYYNESWKREDYEDLKFRLKSICTLINDKRDISRQSLKQAFFERKTQLHEAPEDVDLQNDFVAIICSAYAKVVGKTLYPTQILTLIVNLKLAPQNLVFEIDTGEGKGVTIALLALMKAARGSDNVVLVKTTILDLVKQDLYEKKNAAFFNLFDVPCDVLSQNIDLKDIKKGAIYYTADADRSYDVLMERFSSSPRSLPFRLDIIADEIDSILFDQNTPTKLSVINPQLQDYTWIYSQINHFIDQMQDLGDQELVEQLKIFLIKNNNTIPERVEQIQRLKDSQWMQWLVVAQRAKKLRENQDFVVRYIKKTDCYAAVPYIQEEIKNGFSMSDSLLSGLEQFLHARLNNPQRHFPVTPEMQPISYLDVSNLKNVSSIVGFTGSIGDITDIWEYQEALQANSLRVGRFKENKLKTKPPLIAENEEALIKKIAEIAHKEEQPILIFASSVEEAHRFNDGLQKLLSNKCLKLITGIEDDALRQSWLYGREGEFAKAKNAVTITSDICSRGVDIAPDVYEPLFVIDCGISMSRKATQRKGRTGRAGDLGFYQLMINAEAIEREWQAAFNFSKYPLNRDTLPTYMNKIQGQLNAKNRSMSMNIRLIAWSRAHVIEQLKKVFQGRDFQHEYLQYIHTWFLQISEEKLNTQKVIEASSVIWKKLMALVIVSGHGHLWASTDHSLEKNLVYALSHDTENALLLINSEHVEGTFFQSANALRKNHSRRDMPTGYNPEILIQDELNRAHENEKNQAAQSSHASKKELRNRLLNDKSENTVKETFFMYLFSFIRPIFQWLNPVATLTTDYLEDAWQTFKEDPSEENWDEFYRLLISAKKLYQQQKAQSIWHIDYWFDVFNQLQPWMTFDIHVDRELKNLDFISQSTDKNVFMTIKNDLNNQEVIPSNHQPKGLIDRFMQSFQPLFKQDLDVLIENYQAFLLHPDAHTFHVFYRQLQKVQEFHQESQEWRSWRIDYWWYWQSKMTPWMDVARNLPNILEFNETADLQKWKGQQKNISDFQLSCRENLICQEQLRNQDRRYGFWFWGKSNPVSEFNAEIAKKTSSDMMKYELDEIARYFPKEAMKNYNLFHKGTLEAPSEKQHTRYLRLLALMKDMFAPSSCQLSLDLSTLRMRMFSDELEKWRTRPELMSVLNSDRKH